LKAKDFHTLGVSYVGTRDGLAQFAAILLNNVDVLDSAQWNFNGGERGLKNWVKRTKKIS